MASYASLSGNFLEGTATAPLKGKSWRESDRYLKDLYDWEKKNPERTTNKDGSARTEVGNVQPKISKSLADQGYYYARTGDVKSIRFDRGGGAGDGSKAAQRVETSTPLWTLMRYNVAKADNDDNSSPAPAPAAPDNKALQARADAVERADQYLKESPNSSYALGAAPPSPFGAGLYAQTIRTGDEAVERSRRMGDLAEARGLLGIGELGETLKNNIAAINPKNVKITKPMGLNDWSALLEKFDIG